MRVYVVCVCVWVYGVDAGARGTVAGSVMAAGRTRLEWNAKVGWRVN